MHTDREHVISVVLNDADWKAFVRAHPQPVAWLRERIQDEVKRQNASATASSQAVA